MDRVEACMTEEEKITYYGTILAALLYEEKISIECQDHYQRTVEFASRIGRLSDLYKTIVRLVGAGTYFGKPAKVVLYSDFAPASFGFSIVSREEPHRLFSNGGVIFHGPHDGWGSGAEPSFSVSLSPSRELAWSIHT